MIARSVPALCLVFLLALAPRVAFAEPDFRFEGAFAQGGLVMGKAPPGATLHLDGKAVRLSREGDFVIGFGRDAALKARLAYRLPDGAEGALALAIAPREFPVERVNGLPQGLVTPPPADLKRIQEESAALARAREADSAGSFFKSGVAWPVLGRVSGVFGSLRILNDEPRSPHAGTDIAAPKGTPVAAAMDGTVADVYPDLFFTGKTVLLDHGHGLFTVYAHLDRIDVTAGRRVRKGDPIGALGASGRATAPHLHWGMSWLGVPLDPELAAGPMPRPEAAVSGAAE